VANVLQQTKLSAAHIDGMLRTVDQPNAAVKPKTIFRSDVFLEGL
jgi:hypothetical protein